MIHTVGPIWTHRADIYEKDLTEANGLLASCYYNSLMLAETYELKSIAFPCISTGVYGFPQKAAAEVALKEIKKFLSANNIKFSKASTSQLNLLMQFCNALLEKK